MRECPDRRNIGASVARGGSKGTRLKVLQCRISDEPLSTTSDRTTSDLVTTGSA